MWYALCDAQSGELESLGTVVADDAAERFDVVEVGPDRPDLGLVAWDPATRAFLPRPAPVLVDRADELRDRFQAAFQANADFMSVYNTLTTARRTTLRAAMLTVLQQEFRAILGFRRWRREDEPQGVD